MKGETGERRRNLLWGIPASLILHVLVVALLVYGLPVPFQQPHEEQPVNVELVPAPDRPKPAPAPPPKPPELKVEKPPEPKVEKKPPPPEKQAQKPLPIEVLKPVFQFGDKDAGPRKSLDGASAQDNSPEPAKDDASKPPVEQDVAKQQGAEPAPSDADGGGEIELPMSVEKPKPKPANVRSPSKASKSAPRNGSGLPGVRKLYSQGATGDALATTSMGGVARVQRGAKLCASALQQQLLDASYFPFLIPSVPLKAGNVLNAPDVAFCATKKWYHLGFRCEVDSEVTKVLSFDFRVGSVIPTDEAVRLELPTCR